MTLEEKVDGIYSFLVQFQEQTNIRFQNLEEKFEAVYQLALETAHFAQETANRLNALERKFDLLQADVAELKLDVAKLKHDVAELNAGQQRLEKRLYLFEDRTNAQQTHISNTTSVLAHIEKRLQNLEDVVFPPITITKAA